MTLRERLGRFLTEPLDEVKLKRKTKIAGGPPKYFDPQTRNASNLTKYQTIYEQGGLVAEAIDSYPLFTLSKGYRFEGDGPVDMVKSWAEGFDLEGEIWKLMVEAIVKGDGFAENVANLGGGLAKIEVRPAEKFDLQMDDYGVVTGYMYGKDLTKGGVPLKLEDLTRLTIFTTPGQHYGVPLVKRAFDDIMRDTKVAEGLSKAIERHGFPKWHIKATAPGTAENSAESISLEDAKQMEREFAELSAKNEMITDGDVQILPLDVGAIQNADVYSNVSIQRLCTAMGVPEEILGLGRGSTEATANVRLRAWYDKISTIQKKVARCLNLNVIDRVTGSPGSVRLVFNEVNPRTQVEIADTIQKLTGNALDPEWIISGDEAREMLGMKPRVEENAPPQE